MQKYGRSKAYLLKFMLVENCKWKIFQWKRGRDGVLLRFLQLCMHFVEFLIYPWAILFAESEERAVIMEAIGDFMEYTSVSFDAKKSSDRNFVKIVKKEGCSSHVGRRGGAQKLNIGAECAYVCKHNNTLDRPWVYSFY